MAEAHLGHGENLVAALGTRDSPNPMTTINDNPAPKISVAERVDEGSNGATENNTTAILSLDSSKGATSNTVNNDGTLKPANIDTHIGNELAHETSDANTTNNNESRDSGVESSAGKVPTTYCSVTTAIEACDNALAVLESILDARSSASYPKTAPKLSDASEKIATTGDTTPKLENSVTMQALLDTPLNAEGGSYGGLSNGVTNDGRDGHKDREDKDDIIPGSCINHALGISEADVEKATINVLKPVVINAVANHSNTKSSNFKLPPGPIVASVNNPTMYRDLHFLQRSIDPPPTHLFLAESPETKLQPLRDYDLYMSLFASRFTKASSSAEEQRLFTAARLRRILCQFKPNWDAKKLTKILEPWTQREGAKIRVVEKGVEIYGLEKEEKEKLKRLESDLLKTGLGNGNTNAGAVEDEGMEKMKRLEQAMSRLGTEDDDKSVVDSEEEFIPHNSIPIPPTATASDTLPIHPMAATVTETLACPDNEEALLKPLEILTRDGREAREFLSRPFGQQRQPFVTETQDREIDHAASSPTMTWYTDGTFSIVDSAGIPQPSHSDEDNEQESVHSRSSTCDSFYFDEEKEKFSVDDEGFPLSKNGEPREDPEVDGQQVLSFLEGKKGKYKYRELVEEREFRAQPPATSNWRSSGTVEIESPVQKWELESLSKDDETRDKGMKWGDKNTGWATPGIQHQDKSKWFTYTISKNALGLINILLEEEANTRAKVANAMRGPLYRFIEAIVIAGQKTLFLDDFLDMMPPLTYSVTKYNEFLRQAKVAITKHAAEIDGLPDSAINMYNAEKAEEWVGDHHIDPTSHLHADISDLELTSAISGGNIQMAKPILGLEETYPVCSECGEIVTQELWRTVDHGGKMCCEDCFENEWVLSAGERWWVVDLEDEVLDPGCDSDADEEEEEYYGQFMYNKHSDPERAPTHVMGSTASTRPCTSLAAPMPFELLGAAKKTVQEIRAVADALQLPESVAAQMIGALGAHVKEAEEALKITQESVRGSSEKKKEEEAEAGEGPQPAGPQQARMVAGRRRPRLVRPKKEDVKKEEASASAIEEID